MYYALTRREHLLQHFPKGGVGVEIGVAQGDYSAVILEAAQPDELHLIDPWSHLEEGSDLLGAARMLAEVDRSDVFGAPPENSEGDEQFAAISARFQVDPRVRFHRQYSYKAAAGFADGSFDFVYLDGNHQYEFVLRDLEDFSAKLKPGGLLFGHDYFEDSFASAEHYGVVDAVNTFLKRSDFRFLLLTSEPFPTYCLAGTLDGFAGEFLRNVIDSDVELIELPDSVASAYREKSLSRSDGSARRMPSFAGAS
jgi:hypothetical protein